MNPPPTLAARVLEVRTEPVQQRSAERITLLLDAAAQLVEERGLEGLTTSEVAQRSGSSVGVVYRYFPNMQSLLRGLAARNLERFNARIAAVLDAIEPGSGWPAGVNAVIDVYVELARTEPGFRALRLGDVIDAGTQREHDSANALLARAFTDVLVSRYGLPASDHLVFELEVAIAVADALLHRAFLVERAGDPRFIERARALSIELLARDAAPGAA